MKTRYFKRLLLRITTLVFFCSFTCVTFSQPAVRPTISLTVWDGKAREGSDAAEFIFSRVEGSSQDLTVSYSISGTAKNGYDYRIRNEIRLRSKQTSLKIKPVDDTEQEGDETVTITLNASPAYNIDPDNASQTITILDNEIPDVQFSSPCSSAPESDPGSLKVILSRPSASDVRISYLISGRLAQNGHDDFKNAEGTLLIPAGKTEGIVALNITDDSAAEDDETIVAEIIKAENANIGLNEKHYYTIVNDDGEITRSAIYDRVYGIILGSRGGSSLGAVVEGVEQIEEIEKLYGTFDEFLPCNHYDVFWSHPAGGTEDGIERQKCISTAIIEKQDRISAGDLMKVWVRDYEMEDMYYMTQPYDKTLMAYAKWGCSPEELPDSKFGGMPDDLGGGIHLTARVFHPIPAINAGDPEGAIRDTREIGRLYYEDKDDPAFIWGGVYNAAITLAMLPGATVNSVIEGALKYATPEIRKEIEAGLSIADKYSDPMDRRFREELNSMYADPASPYYAARRMTRYIGSSVYENVTCSFAILKASKGDVELAVRIANNRGRDTDCTAASAGGLAGALTGTATIPQKWVDMLEKGLQETPYSNSHMTMKATAQGLYRALQNKLKRMSAELKIAEKQYRKLPAEYMYTKNYLALMRSCGVDF